MLKRAIIAAALMIALFQTGMFVFAAPLPPFFLFVVYGRRNGWLSLGIASVLAFLAVALKVAGIYDVVYFSYFMMIAAILGEGAHARTGLLKLSSLAIIAPWFVFMAGFVVIQFGWGVDIVSDIRSYLASTMDQIFRLQDSVASLSAPQVAFIKENTAYIVDFMVATIPAAMFIFGMMVVSVTLLLARAFTKKYGALKYFGNVAAQRFPFWPVWMTIACGAAFFANSYLAHNIYLKFFAINGLFICAGIFFIQGCFVVSFWLHKGRSPLLKLLVYGLIIAFLQVVGFIIIALGLSDQWIDYRKKGVHHNTTIA